MLALLLPTLLLISMTTGQELTRGCSDVNLRANISVEVGQDVSLRCEQDQCPPASRITWFRSDNLDERGARYPLVSDHPTMLTVRVSDIIKIETFQFTNTGGHAC